MAVGKETHIQAHNVAGVELSAVKAGIRYRDRLDLVLVAIVEGARTAAVFTQNAFCAAPVTVARRHLLAGQPRYLLINTGNANAGTGAAGVQAAEQCCGILADLTAVASEQVLPFSTGVIGEPLPIEPFAAALPGAVTALDAGHWELAARGIMTTDTRPKLATRQLQLDGRTITISGMAKGAGMIKPNMATMLAFIFTDAGIQHSDLQGLLKKMVERSFNRITVDGDTSTNDSCVLVATGQAGPELTAQQLQPDSVFTEALDAVFVELATGLIRDAEGASKFVTIQIRGGATEAECLQVAYCVAESPLVKTALFASDPNWGRILAAVGRAGLSDLQLDRVRILLGDVCIVSHGGRNPDYSEGRGQAVMDQDEITITIELGRGSHSETVWTSDLSREYVRINAEYRS